MTPHQVQLIKKSWRVFQKINPETVADVFYSKLFSEQPSLRKMFPKEMQSQYQKFMDMMHSMIARLDQVETLENDLQAMGERHKGYGVKDHHYGVVGESLIWTLEKGLGADFTEELREAWLACYQIIARKMTST